MGSGCSTNVREGSEFREHDLPSRPAYQACDLVGPPFVENINVGPVNLLLAQASQFAETVCQLNDSYSGLLLDVRLVTSLLQGGFSVSLWASPNVDIFSVELLTADGQPLDVAGAARLRGRDLACQGRLAALDASLTSCLEQLADFFARNVGTNDLGLTLSPRGTLVPRSPGQVPDPIVDAFNRTMIDMRSALGSDYLLALHLHKATAHGMPAFRVRLLKPLPLPAAEPTPAALLPPHEALAAQSLLPSVYPYPAPGPYPYPGPGPTPWLIGGGPPAAPQSHPPAPQGWEPTSLLDQAACLNASRLANALHGFHDANGRLAEALQAAGIHTPDALTMTSSRTVALSGTPASSLPAHNTTPANPMSGPPTRSYKAPPHRLKSSSTANTTTPYTSGVPHGYSSRPPHPPGGATAAVAVRRLPAATRGQLLRAVEGLNAAAHALGHAAAAAPGPASFAALLTHVLGELREAVETAGGDAALEAYKPYVSFAVNPDGTLYFKLDPHLDVARGAVWAPHMPPFPECLSPPVRRAWLLLQQLLRLHDSIVTQLESLRQLAAAFDDGLRRRVATIEYDAAAARLTPAAAAGAARVLVRNQMELQACYGGALRTLAGTAALVREEMEEAAQLARVQCGFMSPMSWSISLASSSATATTGPCSSSASAGTATSSASSGPAPSPSSTSSSSWPPTAPTPPTAADPTRNPSLSTGSASLARCPLAGTGSADVVSSAASASDQPFRTASRNLSRMVVSGRIRSMNATSRQPSGATLGGWVAVEKREQASTRGVEGQGLGETEAAGSAPPAGGARVSPARQTPQGRQPGAVGQSAGSIAGSSLGGGLAEEYARVALAHLQET